MGIEKSNGRDIYICDECGKRSVTGTGYVSQVGIGVNYGRYIYGNNCFCCDGHARDYFRKQEEEDERAAQRKREEEERKREEAAKLAKMVTKGEKPKGFPLETAWYNSGDWNGVKMSGCSYSSKDDKVTIEIDRLENNAKGPTGSLRVCLEYVNSDDSVETAAKFYLDKLAPNEHYNDLKKTVDYTRPKNRTKDTTPRIHVYELNGEGKWVGLRKVEFKSEAEKEAEKQRQKEAERRAQEEAEAEKQREIARQKENQRRAQAAAEERKKQAAIEEHKANINSTIGALIPWTVAIFAGGLIFGKIEMSIGGILLSVFVGLLISAGLQAVLYLLKKRGILRMYDQHPVLYGLLTGIVLSFLYPTLGDHTKGEVFVGIILLLVSGIVAGFICRQLIDKIFYNTGMPHEIAYHASPLVALVLFFILSAIFGGLLYSSAGKNFDKEAKPAVEKMEEEKEELEEDVKSDVEKSAENLRDSINSKAAELQSKISGLKSSADKDKKEELVVKSGMDKSAKAKNPPSKFSPTDKRLIVGQSFITYDVDTKTGEVSWDSQIRFKKNGKDASDDKYTVDTTTRILTVTDEDNDKDFYAYSLDGNFLYDISEEDGTIEFTRINANAQFNPAQASEVTGKTFSGTWSDGVTASISFGDDGKASVKFSDGDTASGAYLADSERNVVAYNHRDKGVWYEFYYNDDSADVRFTRRVVQKSTLRNKDKIPYKSSLGYKRYTDWKKK